MRRYLVFTLLMLAASLTSAKLKPAPAPPISEVIKENASSTSTTVDRAKALHTQQENATTHGVVVDSAAPPDPEIKVIRKADATIEEYRFKSKLYMVKVTPKSGRPYYLYDEAGNGIITRRDDGSPHSASPRWTLFSW